MAGKRKNRKNYRKKKLTLYQGLRSPVPVKLTTKLRYNQFFEIDPPIGGVAVNIMSANGLYNPSITSILDHQPRGFDQLMAMYDHYVCIGAKIHIEWVPADDADGYSQICGVSVQDNQISKTDIYDYLESGKVDHTTISPRNPQRTAITMTVNPNNFLGRSKPLADPELKGSVVSNPTEGCFFHIFNGPFQGVDPTGLYVNVTIDYTVVLIEPKTPAIS